MFVGLLARFGLLASLAILAIFADASKVDAQDRTKVEIVSGVPHSSAVYSVASSPDGQRVLSSSSDDTIKLWDVATGRLLRTFVGHLSSVSAAVFSSDGERIISGSADRTLKLWHTATGHLVRNFEGHISAVAAVAFSPDGALVVSGSYDKTLKLWDSKSGKEIRTLNGHTGPVTAAAFSPDGSRILSGSLDKTLKLWDTPTGRLLHTFKGHTAMIHSVAFSPEGNRLLSGSGESSPSSNVPAKDCTVKLWDAASGRLIQTINAHSHEVRSVAFSLLGNRFLSASQDGTLKLWDASKVTLVQTIEEVGISVAAFSPDGTIVLSGHGNGKVKLWDAATGRTIQTLTGSSDQALSVSVSPDGTRFLLGGQNVSMTGNTLWLWDAMAPQPIHAPPGVKGNVLKVDFSPDGTQYVSVSADGTSVWNTASGRLVRTLKQQHVGSAALSPDGKHLLANSFDDKTLKWDLKLWSVERGEVIRSTSGPANGVIAFSPKGLHFVLASQRISLFDLSSGHMISTFNKDYLDAGIASLAFSPDGTRLISGGDSGGEKAVDLWEINTGKLIHSYKGHRSRVGALAFSPNGQSILSGSWDNTLRLWDSVSGELKSIFPDHAGPVNSVAFSPNGKRVFSASRDGAVRIWNAEDGKILVTVFTSRDGEWLAMTPVGFFAASRKGTEMVAIVRGLDLTNVSQIQQSLFNPDLVREALAGDLAHEVREATKVMSLEKVLDSAPAPSVTLLGGADIRSSSEVVTLRARIKDAGKGIGRIEWRLNGITAAVAAKPEGQELEHTVSQQLALDPGDNTIEVVAYNGSNLLASPPARTTIKFTGPADGARSKLHILAIGINDYVDRGWTPPGRTTSSYFPPLALAVKDATRFGADMKQAGSTIYEEVRVTYALDQEATRDNLGRTIDRLSGEIHPRDTFIFFAAGHGFSADGRFYLIPQDYQGGENPEELARNAIGQDTLQVWLANRIKAKRAVILLDTCRSGALVAGHLRARAGDLQLSEAAIGRLHEATGRPVLTAAAASQDAYEGIIVRSGERHGLFTWALLDALRSGDTNNNGHIELSELVAHVQNLVPQLAAELGGSGRTAFNFAALRPVARQTARFGSRGEDFMLVSRLH